MTAASPTISKPPGASLAEALRAATPALLFSLRLWASVCLSLYVAFALELSEPSWAATTAALVCQPVLGASLRKSMFRLIGTMVGAVAIVVLAAFARQDRAGFLIGLAANKKKKRRYSATQKKKRKKTTTRQQPVNDALFLPQTRGKFRELLALGLTDALRATTDAPGLYTFWDYQAGAWQKNNGIRIDHLLLSPEAADRLTSVTIDKEMRGRDKASDHTPVRVELAA